MNEAVPNPVERIAEAAGKLADAVGSVADAFRSAASTAGYSIHEICVVALTALLLHHVFAWLRGAK